ncbi:hypothetical protein KO849_004187 [Salmonella enterica]|nr:hypothetical protein [Salmonella enterica]EHP4331124.1 hypothetical protein [Salmonella enterica]EII2809180.1 hypothetical protein [Salmonella enterica subsp. enterica serovar Java]EMC7604841.1 hypothetical protein [Salmonella enterica]HAG2582241.1 hypothetical protein [Salmonella enterica]
MFQRDTLFAAGVSPVHLFYQPLRHDIAGQCSGSGWPELEQTGAFGCGRCCYDGAGGQ